METKTVGKLTEYLYLVGRAESKLYMIFKKITTFYSFVDMFQCGKHKLQKQCLKNRKTE